ncbi:hypothetical protein [Streptomyces sp. NPDC093093]|uniref:hypothetical protein n=1 Tax=Streptomyces sp. NPDC093093 TaxID=3366025 RepID=UPI00382ECE14
MASVTGLVFARRGDTRTTLRETVVQHFFPDENPPILFFWLEPDRLSEEDVPAPDEESG